MQNFTKKKLTLILINKRTKLIFLKLHALIQTDNLLYIMEVKIKYSVTLKISMLIDYSTKDLYKNDQSDKSVLILMSSLNLLKLHKI